MARPPVKTPDLLQILSAPDSILESDAPRIYRQYVNEPDGTAQLANDAITYGYDGVGTMANQMADWLKLAGGDPDAVIHDVLGETLTDGRFQTRAADRSFRSLSSSTELSLDFLNDVARSELWWPHIDALRSRRAVTGASPLLESLRQRHDLAMGSSDLATTPAEVASGTLTPESCTKAIMAYLRDLMSRPLNEADLRKFYDACVQSATCDELTMVLWLRLLADMTVRSKDGLIKSLLRRCSQEIRVAATLKAARASNVSEKDALALATRLALVIDTQASGARGMQQYILSDLFAVVSVRGKGRGACLREIERLTKLYGPLRRAEVDDEGSAREGAAVPTEKEGTASPMEKEGTALSSENRVAYLEMLSQPEILEMIWRKLFVRKVRLPEDPVYVAEEVNVPMRNCLCMLLALAVVYLRNKSTNAASSANGSPVTAFLPLATDSERQEARTLEDILISCVTICSHLHPDSTARAFAEKTSEKLVPKSGTLAQGTYDHVLKDGITRSEVVAHGVVLWAREGLTETTDADKLVKSCLCYLTLLEFAAEKWSSVREDVLSVFADAYGRVWWSRTDSHRNVKIEEKFRSYFGKALLSMFRLKYGARVLDLYRERFAEDDDIDSSYVRMFVTDMISFIKLPFSAPFAQSLLALLGTERVVSAIRSEQQGALRSSSKTGSTIVANILVALGGTLPVGLDEGRVSEVRQIYATS